MAMAETTLKLDRVALSEISDDDDEVLLVTAAAKPSLTTPISNRKHIDDDDDDDDDEDEDEDNKPSKDVDLKLGLDNSDSQRSEAQATGMMVLALLDRIIGVVDQIQLTQNGLESRQESMEKNMSGIQSELHKLSKSQGGTAGTVTKLLEKVRKVNVNVKSVRSELEKQAGQIKKLETNEHELLKRKNFKVLIFQDKEKPVKTTQKPEAAVGEEGEHVLSEGEEPKGTDEVVEIEETVEESRVARIKRSGLQRVDEIKKAFSKEQMEKTKQRTKENLEKTRQRTKENLEKTRVRTRENFQKTRVTLGKKMGKLGTKIRPKKERKEKIRVSREKIKKSLKSDKVYARSKITTYRVPPFTFYVKKIREGEVPEPESEPDDEAEELQVEDKEDAEAKEAELVNLSSPDEALLEAVDHSQLVIQDSVKPREKASQ
ncbi:caveolae-associated protein 1 [Tachysurus vachellii]|uniref:caveolae-associated protein 1 n=1 Tax=Tachysurus vachellii TaxID=175792 RepID=UPI00296ADB62|nr:caveolae-associated protein 1 [Tachysurus vachellii]